MGSENEIVAIVDEDNNVIGSAPRWQMRAENLIHRATYILVFNSTGEVFLQKRTLTKDVFPGYYDVATGGVVLAGENYEESAARELAEELGITGVPMHFLFDFFYSDVSSGVWGRAFSCVYDGEMVLQDEEVASGAFCDPQEIVDGKFAPSTPDGMYVLRRYLDR